jgi:hypothetical protein
LPLDAKDFAFCDRAMIPSDPGKDIMLENQRHPGKILSE